MGFLQAFILGVVQGLTEFFPVSSSGHLVIFQHFFQLGGAPLLFDVCVHAGTLIAVILYYYRDIFDILVSLVRPFVSSLNRVPTENDMINRRLALFIVIGSIPTAIIGYGLNHIADVLFSSLPVVSGCLLFTALMIYSTRWIPSKIPAGGEGSFGVFQAILVGVMQGVSAMPGISRSGSTISVALFTGMDRAKAARFSFLLSIPTILGALVLNLASSSTGSMHIVPLPVILTGMVASGLVGFVALCLLVKIVVFGRLHYFAPYCVLLAGIAFGMWMLGV